MKIEMEYYIFENVITIIIYSRYRLLSNNIQRKRNDLIIVHRMFLFFVLFSFFYDEEKKKKDLCLQTRTYDY